MKLLYIQLEMLLIKIIEHRGLDRTTKNILKWLKTKNVLIYRLLDVDMKITMRV